MNYNYIKKTINEIPLDVYFSPDYKTMWLSRDDLANLFYVDVEEIDAHVNKLYERKVLDKEKVYDSEKDLFNLLATVLIGSHFHKNNLSKLLAWRRKYVRECKRRKAVSSENFNILVRKIIEADIRINNLTEGKI